MSVLYLSRNESTVYELVCAGLTPTEIAERMGVTRAAVYSILKRLVVVKAVTRLDKRHHYQGRISAYEVVGTAALITLRRRASAIVVYPEPYYWVQLSEAMVAKIKEYHSAKSRREIAAELGVPRYLINREIMRLGIAQDE